MASSLATQAITFVFIISTIYGFSYYWAEGSGDSIGVPSIDDGDGSLFVNVGGNSAIATLLLDSVDTILEFVSWISLFAVVKAILVLIVPTDLYTPINLFLLRPTGWIAAFITTEWVINKVRGSSEN
jgi:hypothetical protein